MRTITKQGNKVAWLLAFLISAMVMTMFLPALTEAKELTLIDHINSVRSKPLKEDKFLTDLAKDRCRTMREWSHQGYYTYANEIMYSFSWRGLKVKNRFAGENLAEAYTNDKDVFLALQASPGHKANNESEKFQKLGVARCNNKVGLVTVLLFAGN